MRARSASDGSVPHPKMGWSTVVMCVYPVAGETPAPP